MLNSSACSILVSWDPLEAKEIEVEEELQSKFFWERSPQCRMEEAVRHSKQRSHHSTAVLETPPSSKGLPLRQKQSHKSIFGNKGKKENFYGPSSGYVKFVQMGKPEKARVWKETSPYQEKGMFLLGFSD